MMLACSKKCPKARVVVIAVNSEKTLVPYISEIALTLTAAALWRRRVNAKALLGNVWMMGS